MPELYKSKISAKIIKTEWLHARLVNLYNFERVFKIGQTLF